MANIPHSHKTIGKIIIPYTWIFTFWDTGHKDENSKLHGKEVRQNVWFKQKNVENKF